MEQSKIDTIFKKFKFNRYRFNESNVCDGFHEAMQLINVMNTEIEDLKQKVKELEMVNGE